jgi:hypothetical protein
MTSKVVVVQCYSSLTMAQGGWMAGQRGAPAALPLGRPITSVQEAGWAPGPVLIVADNIAPTSIQFLDLPAHSKSLY